MNRIGMNAGMQLRGEQQMLLQPRMIQSIEVLQLPTAELETYLREASESNEALRVDAPPADAGSYEPRGTRADSDAHDEMLRNQPDRAQSVAQIVEQQLAVAGFQGELNEWVRLLVGCLDQRGYLSASDEQLLAWADEHGLAAGPENLGRAKAALQSLEPRGIGARNAVEALILQLDPEHPEYDHLCVLLEDFLQDLAHNKLPGVARAMGLELEHLGYLIDLLRDLDPSPAASLVQDLAPLIRPDVLVEWTGNGHEIRLARGCYPPVAVDPDVQTMARDRSQTTEVRSYLRQKVDQARWIVEAVEQRAHTLLRIGRQLFAHQRAFLERGPGHLVPLRMNQLADELGVHVSTVSRGVGGKYAQTPWGILPLRSFFQAAAGANPESARGDVRERVREIIAAEDTRHPLSDDEIVSALVDTGVQIARRTVAKYRRELGIPSSYRRRKYLD